MILKAWLSFSLAVFAAILTSCTEQDSGSQRANQTKAGAAQAAEWTVMVYMNGKNNLEEFAIDNFSEIAETGSTSRVNYVAELGRPDPQQQYDDRFGNWSGVRRYLIQKDQQPTAEAAVEFVGAHDKVDMGSGQTLVEFIRWAKATYPAKNYALIIWNHGQGYRIHSPAFGAKQFIEMSALDARVAAEKHESLRPASYRSVSSDDDFRSTLYNSDVRDALSSGFATGELKLLGFDACSMAMIESAYEFRNVAPLMVASEELEPGPGWRYTKFVPALAAKPNMTARELGEAIVAAYQQGYGDNEKTTLSLIDLTRVGAAADRVSDVGSYLATKLPAERATIETARASVGSYTKHTRTTVDAITVLEAIRAKFPQDQQLQSRVSAATSALKASVIANYASKQRQGPWGSLGVAIFFPLDSAAHKADWNSEGYRPDNNFKTISFVREKKWANFVSRYVQ